MGSELNDFEMMIVEWFKTNEQGRYIAERSLAWVERFREPDTLGDILRNDLATVFDTDEVESRPHHFLQDIYQAVFDHCDWTKIAEAVR
jgi:hypothetical protein